MTTVDNGAAKIRARLFDRSNGAAKHGERETGLVKWSEESAELQLLLDVGGDIAGGQTGGGEVGFGVARLGRRSEGDVPAKREVLEEGISVEVGPKSSPPDRYVEGWGWERDAEAVDIGGSAESDGSRDPVDVTLLV